MPYSVTGALSNINVKVAEANNVTPATYYNFNNHVFQNEINTRAKTRNIRSTISKKYH